MARPLRIEYPGAFYHVISRGNEKKEIFKTRRDRERFLEYLESAVNRYGAVIHCYCLMVNHYHLFLETPEGNLSKVMQYLNGAYTIYFNIKHCRSGHLLQGRYKAFLVEADTYALELSRYIHLNPVRAEIVSFPEDYPWSSYHAYIGRHNAPDWLNIYFLQGFLGGDEKQRCIKYRDFVKDRLAGDDPNSSQPFFVSTILGSEDFVSRIKEKHLNPEANSAEVPELKALRSRPTIKQIVGTVSGRLSEDPKLAKKIMVYLSHQYTGEKLNVIGEHFNLGVSGVSQLSRRFSRQLKCDHELKKLIDVFVRELNLSNVKI
ncbi:MAG: hypothetical protein C0623_08620 [Desulfuromonas sp.]|nr:MAG: hypothetical protein C0623_08620 [Desulfuromonas sp.]